MRPMATNGTMVIPFISTAVSTLLITAKIKKEPNPQFQKNNTISNVLGIEYQFP